MTRKGKSGIWPAEASGCVWSRLMSRLLARGVGKCKAKGFRGRGTQHWTGERNATYLYMYLYNVAFLSVLYWFATHSRVQMIRICHVRGKTYSHRSRGDTWRHTHPVRRQGAQTMLERPKGGGERLGSTRPRSLVYKFNSPPPSTERRHSSIPVPEKTGGPRHVRTYQKEAVHSSSLAQPSPCRTTRSRCCAALAAR